MSGRSSTRDFRLYYQGSDGSVTSIQEIVEENARYKEALEFYAERKHIVFEADKNFEWIAEGIPPAFDMYEASFVENGHFAREALGVYEALGTLIPSRQ